MRKGGTGIDVLKHSDGAVSLEHAFIRPQPVQQDSQLACHGDSGLPCSRSPEELQTPVGQDVTWTGSDPSCNRSRIFARHARMVCGTSSRLLASAACPAPYPAILGRISYSGRPTSIVTCISVGVFSLRSLAFSSRARGAIRTQEKACM